VTLGAGIVGRDPLRYIYTARIDCIWHRYVFRSTGYYPSAEFSPFVAPQADRVTVRPADGAKCRPVVLAVGRLHDYRRSPVLIAATY
jgi:hypothetical protein